MSTCRACGAPGADINIDGICTDCLPQPNPPRNRWYQIRARKIGGSYQADGWIVSTFLTRSGQVRYVFEFETPAGMLHIFNTDQVELL